MKNLFVNELLGFSAVVLSMALAQLSFGAEPKQIYAHYMGCFPVGRAATAYHERQARALKERTYESTDWRRARHGRKRNFCLIPEGKELTREESAELEVNRALQGGLEGFAIDAWAGGEGAQQVFDDLIGAAERLKAPFGVTICLDASCLPGGSTNVDNTAVFADAVRYAVVRHSESPNLARRKGNPLIFGYASHAILRRDPARHPTVLSHFAAVADTYDRMERLVGKPLTIHFDASLFTGLLRTCTVERATSVGKIVGERFDAVGSFLFAELTSESGRTNVAAFARGVRSAGAEWSEPMWWQYHSGDSVHTGMGLDRLRRNWQAANDNQSTLIQFVTWNDYNEATGLAPLYKTGYAVLDVNRLFVRDWKANRKVPAEKDEAYLFFRTYGPDARVFPHGGAQYEPGAIEVFTSLKQPAQVLLKERGISYLAPAGIDSRQFPLSPGPLSVAVQRGGETVASVRSEERISDRPWREDNEMNAESSTFLEHWYREFSEAKVPHRQTEYADDDGDGLPNWFEECYQIQHPDDDPNGDGVKAIEEWRQQRNPLVKSVPYAVGYEWNFDQIFQRGLSFNPDLDENAVPRWYYYYKPGKQWKVQVGEPYFPTICARPNIPYAGKMCQFSPVTLAGYRNVYSWISRKKNAAGVWENHFVPNDESAVVLGWKSPVRGVVNVCCDVRVAPEPARNDFAIHKNNETPIVVVSSPKKDAPQEAHVSLSVEVTPQDTLYFFAAKRYFWGRTTAVSHLKIKIEKIY